MPEVSGTETGCLKAGLRPRWNVALLAAGLLETALWYWITYFFNQLGSALPQLTSFVQQQTGLCSATGPLCEFPGVRAGEEEVRRVSDALSMFHVMSVLWLDHPHTLGRASQRLTWGRHVPVKDRAARAVAPHLCWHADWMWCLLHLQYLLQLMSWRRHPLMPPCCLLLVSPITHHWTLCPAVLGVLVSETGIICWSVSPLLRMSTHFIQSGMHL